MHKKRKKKVLNILLIPDNESAPKNFRIRYSVLRLAIFAAFLVVAAGVFGVISYGYTLKSALDREAFEHENVQLRRQLKKVQLLSAEVQQLKGYRERVSSSFTGYIKLAEEVDPNILSQKLDKKEGSGHKPFFVVMPLKTPVMGFVSQEFSRPSHNGIDIVAPVGTSVKAAADGVVIFSGRTYKDGYVVMLEHAKGYLTIYRHNSRNLVLENNAVRQGEVIAFLGNSGESSSGPHLHFEIWKDGRPVDPRKFLVNLN